jgi:hypothetical protein
MSEILGTILIFSVVLVISLTLIGFGFQLFSSGGEEISDRQGQDALHETADRLDKLAGSSVNQKTEIAIPANADIESMPEDGTVNVTVKTYDYNGNLSADDIAADSMVGSAQINLGTFRHESSNGAETVYQGGLLFERQGSLSKIYRRPGFDYNNGTIDFSFISISSIQHLSGGAELSARRDLEQSEARAKAIQELIKKQRTIGDNPEDPVGYAEINVTVTIKTDYPEAWKRYAEEQMTERPPQIETEDDRIKFVFEQFMQGDYKEAGDFAENVLYSGVNKTADMFYNESLGTIEGADGGFDVASISGDDPRDPGGGPNNEVYYGIAVADNEMWKIADFPQSNNLTQIDWINVAGEDVPEPDQLGNVSASGGTNQDEWRWDEESIVCLVADEDGEEITTEEMRHAVAEGDCGVGTVGADDDDLPDMQAIYDIDVDVSETAVDVGDQPTFDINVTNVGNGYGDRYVFLAGDFFGDGTELAEYEPVDLYPGNYNDTLEFEFTATSSFNDGEPVIISAGNESEQIETDMTLTNRPEFVIDSLDGVDSFVSAGEEFEVNATITNDGGNETQVVVLKNPDGTVVDSKTLNLEGETKSRSLFWNVPSSAERTGAVELTVETEDDTDTLDVDQEPIALISALDVNVDNSANEVEAQATIENPSDQKLKDATIEVDTDETDLIRSGQTVPPKTIDVDDTKTVTFSWDVDPADEITDWVTVTTSNDSARDVGVLDRSGNEPDCSGVSYEGGDGSDGDPYQINNVDQLQCIEQDLTADYELVGDIAAHGTEYWNGGDGFEPIGEQFDGQGGDAFKGDLNGNDHKIEGMTIDRYDEPFVGIFAITAKFDGSSGLGEGVTIENIRLVDIDVRGMTVVGGLVGGAGGEFSQISVDGRVESQYQQVGGLIGHAHDGDLTNELVSTATVIGHEPIVVDDDDEHPWQETTSSPNLGIGGILGGMGYDTKFSTGYSNADVRGPSSVGGITGWTSNNPSDLRQMYWADGDLELVGSPVVFSETDRKQFTDPLQVGGIAGRIGDPSGSLDTIYDSVYSDGPTVGDGGDANVNDNSIDLRADNMTGPKVLPDDKSPSFYENYPGITKEDAEGTMENLDWEDTWAPVYDIDEDGNIINEELPVFQWQVSGDLIVTITDADDKITPGASGEDGTLEVEATIENPSDSDRENETISLVDPVDGAVVDSVTKTIQAGASENVTLTWETTPRDAVSTDKDSKEFLVRGPDTTDTGQVDIKATNNNVTIDSFSAPNRVEALEELEAEVKVSAEGFDFDDEGTEVALRIGDRIVAVDDSLSGDEGTVKLTWTPTSSDIGNIELTADVLNRAASEPTNVQVVTPAVPVDIEENIPFDIDMEMIGTS